MSSLIPNTKEQKQLSSLLASSAAGSFAVKILGMGIAFGLQVLIARVIGVDQYGIYTYAITWLAVLLLFVTHGWDTATIRFVSAYRANAQWNMLRGFLKISRRMPVYAALGVGVTVLLVVLALQDVIDENLSIVILIGVFILPINALLQVTVAGLQGLKRVVLAQLPQQVIRPVLFAASLFIALYGFNMAPVAENVMALNITSALVVLIIANKMLRSYIPSDVYLAASEHRKKEWLGAALPLLLISGFIMLMNRLDILMLGAMIGTSEAGLYSVASRVAELAAFGLLAVNAIMAPLISDLYATGKLRELQRIISESAIGIAGATLIIGAVLVVFSDHILRLFGVEFIVASDSLHILIAAQVINALAGSVGFIMTMTGQQRTAAIIFGSSAFINAVLNLILIPKYGMEGAAVATATTMVFWNVSMVMVVRSKLGIYPTVLSAWKVLR